MRIEPATPADLEAVRAAYAHARAMQEAKGMTAWPVFPDASILAEIGGGRLFRVLDGDALAGIFSVAYDDPAIWGARERGEHIYLHRIARAPGYAGRGLVAAVVDWADARCRALGRVGLRMDTWASNDALIAYYAGFGFAFVGNVTIGIEPRLPPHYHGRDFALLERECAAAT